MILQTERDVSVRQRAVDLLYAMCDRTNADQIVGEMLIYLEKADYSIREEMVSKSSLIFAISFLNPYHTYTNLIINHCKVKFIMICYRAASSVHFLCNGYDNA